MAARPATQMGSAVRGSNRTTGNGEAQPPVTSPRPSAIERIVRMTGSMLRKVHAANRPLQTRRARTVYWSGVHTEMNFPVPESSRVQAGRQTTFFPSGAQSAVVWQTSTQAGATPWHWPSGPGAEND
jgi:hypothetical protein